MNTDRIIAFIGTGVMGSSMAGHLLDKGFRLRVFNRTADKAGPLLERGAEWADSPGDAADGADIVITMVGYPADVEEVYLGRGGIIERASRGATLIDMTTSTPRLAEKIYDAASIAGLHALDAPVSGGDIGARNAALTIMVGGDAEVFEHMETLFAVMGKSIVHQGPAGAGQHTKMANQVAIAGSMLAAVESMAYAKAVGLDPVTVLQSITAGSAASWSLQNLAPRILGGDFQPGFYVKHFVKDLKIAIEAAKEADIVLPGLELAERLYERLESAGGGDLGTQALWLLYADEELRAMSGVASHASVRAR